VVRSLHSSILTVRELIPNDWLERLMPRREAVVEVVLTDGRTLNDRAGTVRGTVENPMSREEIAAKGARPHRAGAGRGEVAEADRYGICAGTREGHLGPSPADPEG
jgi:hypothetical protein